jgi:hypothetical protein
VALERGGLKACSIADYHRLVKKMPSGFIASASF